MRIKWIGLAACCLGSGGAVAATGAETPHERPFRLCVLDRAAIVQHSRLAQNMGVRFQHVRQQTQAKMEDDKRTLDADLRALNGLRPSIPAAVAKTRDAEIARRRLELKQRGEQVNRDLAALDEQLTANIAKVSDPIVRAVEAEHGCSMLIERSTLPHLGDVSLDITPNVLDRMNASPAPPTPVGR